MSILTTAVLYDSQKSTFTKYLLYICLVLGLSSNAFAKENEGLPVMNNLFVNINATGNNDGTSWADAYTDLQDAIDDAKTGSIKEIWVAQGTYFPTESPDEISTDPRDRSFHFETDMQIYGGFDGTETMLSQRDHALNVTTLSGDFNQDDVVNLVGDSLFFTGNGENAFHVLITQFLSSSAILNGFTISGGNADGPGSIDYGYVPFYQGSGGGIYDVASSAIFFNCNIHSNYCSYDGGGIYSEDSALTIDGCTLNNNRATSGGGGIYNGGSENMILRCTLTNNIAEGGGGFFLGHDIWENTIISKSFFSGNIAYSGGGAISVFSSDITIDSCTFNNNSSNYQGGAIKCIFSDLAIISNCTFNNNINTSSWGGAVLLDNVSGGVITNSAFNNNSSDDGGGICSISNDLTVSNCSFTGNMANYDGGGIYKAYSDLIIDSCFFNNNSAGSGGGLHNELSYIEMDKCVFNNNMATNYGGGFINSDESYEFTDGFIKNCEFLNNNADKGGGIYIEYGSGSIYENCIVSGNTAITNGGGIFFGEHNSDVFNSLISSNTAKYGGGMFYEDDSYRSLINCTISDNSSTISGGGIYSEDDDNVLKIRNTIISGNTSPSDPNIFKNQSTSASIYDFKISNSNIEGSNGSGSGWDPSFGTDMGGNIDVSPQFNNPNGGDFTIDDCSPSRDAGDDSFNSTINDLADNPRKVNTIDMGAYENQSTTGAAPEITLKGKTKNINNGDTTPSKTDGTDFGKVGIGMTYIAEFTIENICGGNLSIGNITTNNPVFTVVQPTSTSLSGAVSITFQIEMSPTAGGTYDGTVIIPNNDSNENPFTFDITASTMLPFISTWQTVANNEEVEIPMRASSTTNYMVDWGDGTITVGHSNYASHTYAQMGTYTVKVGGEFPQIYFNNGSSKSKILTVEQWGSNEWSSMQRAFFGCPNLVFNAVDVPNLSNVTSMNSMFRNATSFNSFIGNWDVSNVTDMASMFQGASSFDEVLPWNVSNVTTMSQMFRDATSFNSFIGSWDVSSVTNMTSMFFDATAFNQDLASWSTTSLTKANTMFRDAIAFNQDLGNWDVSSLTTAKSMLSFCGMDISNYDNTLIGWGGQTVLSGVILGASDRLYCNAEVERQNLLNQGWSITSDDKQCPILVPFITKWETTTANELITIPVRGTGFNYEVNWGDGSTTTGHTGNATHSYATPGVHTIEITGVFPTIYISNNAAYRDKIVSIEQWGDNNWGSFLKSFQGAANLVHNATDAPDLQLVTDMRFAFKGAFLFEGSLGNWNITSVTKMSGMLDNTNLSVDDYDATLIGWASQTVQPNVTLGANQLLYCNAETERNQLITTNGWTITKDEKGCSITDPFITKWETTTALETVIIPTLGSGYDYEVDWGDGNITMGHNGDAQHVYDTAGIYTVQITGDFPRIYHFGLSAANREQLVSIEHWGDNLWTTMDRAFTAAKKLINNADDIPNTSEVKTFRFMFHGAEQFDANLGDWDISNVLTMVYALSNSGLSTMNYDSTLIGWEGQIVKNNVRLSATGLEYCIADTERNNLINNNGWIIVRDNQCPILKQSNPNSNVSLAVLEKYDASISTSLEYVKVHPNPTNGELTLTYDLSIDEEVEIFVRDLSGKLLYLMKTSGRAGTNQVELNFSNYKSGMYLLNLQSGERNVIRKVVKQ